MYGIDLDAEMIYKGALFRYFQKDEYYCTRQCYDDVLLLVFSGVLRFIEDDKEYEIYSGEYHIHKNNTFQTATVPSETPKYLFIHFRGEWTESSNHTLLQDGIFDVDKMMPLLCKMDKIGFADVSICEKKSVFYEILSMLYKTQGNEDATLLLAKKIKQYLDENMSNNISLDELSEIFHYSKNHIINAFKKVYSLTPFEYLIDLRMNRAKRLLEFTDMFQEDIAILCGYRNYSHYYRQFLKKYGLPPNQFRQDSIH